MRKFIQKTISGILFIVLLITIYLYRVRNILTDCYYPQIQGNIMRIKHQTATELCR